MRLRSLPAIACALALAACGARERDGRPNVLLISLDSVRADFVGAYGAELPHAPGRSPTPNLDRLAAEGVLYEDARSTTSWTLPAHATLLTGEPELVHGVEQDGQRLPDDLATLAETLREEGYRTYGVFSGPYLEPRHGFARGFERYEAGYGRELARAIDESALATRLVDAHADDPERARVALDRYYEATQALELASHRDVSSERVTDLALAELARAADDARPFFLFAHYFDPHYDYAPPEPFARAFDPDYAGTLDGRDYLFHPLIAVPDEESPSGRRRVASERELEHLRALYAGEIAWTDAQIGRLLAELERRGLDEDTLVVVVADHGDEFFEHGSIGHRRTLFEEVLRVPLLMRLPSRLTAGERRSGPIELADVQGRILALLGLARDPRPERASVARLVHPEIAQLALELDGSASLVEGFRVRLVECSWSGALKVRRESTLLRAGEALEPERRAAFEELARAESARETLRWIDLAAHPGEEEQAWSDDFASDPRAAAALEAFRASYAELLRRRRSPPVAADSADLLAALRGLGYAGQETRVGTLESAELVLPPPGHGR